jgi:hypothetical protein
MQERGFMGGCLYVKRHDDPTAPVLVFCPLGDEPDLPGEYYINARRHAERVSHDPSTMSSWQLKHGELEVWGGAISTRAMPNGQQLVLSFSGMNEHADEAFCLAVAVFTKLIPLTYAQEIADISENKIFRGLAKLL